MIIFYIFIDFIFISLFHRFYCFIPTDFIQYFNFILLDALLSYTFSIDFIVNLIFCFCKLHILFFHICIIVFIDHLDLTTFQKIMKFLILKIYIAPCSKELETTNNTSYIQRQIHVQFPELSGPPSLYYNLWFSVCCLFVTDHIW